MNLLSERLNRLSPSATLAMSQKSNELKAQGVDVINLSVGEPDFNTPDHIKEAAKQAIDENFSRYSPVPGYPALRNAIVAKLKNENGLEYSPAQISCANGAKQSVCNAIMVLVNAGDEVIIPAPFWVSYPEMVKMADGTPIIQTETAFLGRQTASLHAQYRGGRSESSDNQVSQYVCHPLWISFRHRERSCNTKRHAQSGSRSHNHPIYAFL